MKHHVYNLVILDESGSMMGIMMPTIRGFNEIVQTIKDVEIKFPDQKHFISFVSFNGNGIKEIHWNEEVEKLDLINEKLYKPNASTPLYDAMGRSITKLKEELPKDTTYNVLVTILTDGEENASRNFTGPQIKALVDELKVQSWTFAYIGANHDVERFAAQLSISNTMRFEADEKDMERMFEKEKSARMSMSRKMEMMDKNEFINFNSDFYKEEEK